MPFYFTDENGNQIEIDSRYAPVIQALVGIPNQQPQEQVQQGEITPQPVYNTPTENIQNALNWQQPQQQLQQQTLPPGYVHRTYTGVPQQGMQYDTYSYLPQTGGGMVYAGGRPNVIPDLQTQREQAQAVRGPVRVIGYETYLDGFNRPVSMPVYEHLAPANYQPQPQPQPQPQQFVPTEGQLDRLSQMGVNYNNGIFTNVPSSASSSNYQSQLGTARARARSNMSNRQATTEQPETPVQQTNQTPTPVQRSNRTLTPTQQTNQTPAPDNTRVTRDVMFGRTPDEYRAINEREENVNRTRTTARDALSRNSAYNVENYQLNPYDFNLVFPTNNYRFPGTPIVNDYETFAKRWPTMSDEQKNNFIQMVVAAKVNRAIEGGMRM